VRQAFGNLEFLVVQDIFMSETAKLADVVLPASCFAEKDGTFTNTERRVQRVRKAVEPPAEAREDWRIVMEIANRLGGDMTYSSPEEIWDEVAALSPMMAGVTYPRIDKIGLQWPCSHEEHPGTVCLHEDGFACGLGKFTPVEYSPPAEPTDSEYPWLLTTGRILYHYNVGTMTRRVKGMAEKSPDCFVEIHPRDLEQLGAQSGQMLRVSTRRGSITARAWATKKVRPGQIWMPFHFAEASANELTTDAHDPITKTAEYKVAAALVEVTPD
jgi:predicted molibdopterin-dependent oxidoreductase YjgC